MNYNNEINDIKNKLWDTWYSGLNNHEYIELEQRLDRLYDQNPIAEILFIKTELNLHKINSLKSKNTEYAELGLSMEPDNIGLHDNLNKSMNGLEVDFKKRNRCKIINKYYDFLKTNPDILIAKRILLENLISSYRLDEAKNIIDASLEYAGENLFYLEIQLGEIEYLRGNHAKAKKIWNDIKQKHQSSYKVYFALAEQFANFAEYDDAIEYYSTSYRMQSSPKTIDALQSLIDIYDIKENYNKCVEILEEIINVYNVDYNVFDGPELTTYYERIDVYKKLLKLAEKS